jgi:glyoxylase-like metal-dependent hydrolase (beta-lactamase superfamily II)
MAIFSFGEKPVEGLTAKNAVGHTPGHTAFLLESGGEKLLFIGDLLHAAALQFPYPEMCASYDRDQSQAVISRRNILNEAADLNMPVAGAHIPHSGVGLVAKSGDGFAFTVVPPAR